MSDTATTIESARDGDWLTIALARPDARNALSRDMVAELQALLDATANDTSIRGITMRGQGRVFCAGGDLKGFGRSLDDPEAAAAIEASSRAAGTLFHRVATMPQTTIMAVHGAAMAGGMGLACAGDLTIVTSDCRFALTETRLGIVPAQIAPFVVARAGLPVARRLMLTGAQFDGDAAFELGIADELVADTAALDVAETKLRAEVLACAPGANAATKRLLHTLAPIDAEAYVSHAATVFRQCLQSDEGREGMAAFVAKRKPGWQP
ncbi:MAG: enoyl-CoA hydratase-related protein [Pseudomonadota bacterium]